MNAIIIDVFDESSLALIEAGHFLPDTIMQAAFDWHPAQQTPRMGLAFLSVGSERLDFGMLHIAAQTISERNDIGSREFVETIVIGQRISHKTKNKGLADFLKVLANSGSYGLFVEINTETKKKETKVRFFSGEKKGEGKSSYVETPGTWYFPPVASLITAGGRLLLAMLEKSVDQKGGTICFAIQIHFVSWERKKVVSLPAKGEDSA